MKSFEIKIISIILLFFFFSPGKNQTFAAPNKKYLSKGFIDGSIGRAFYVLTEAASVAGVGFRQREAIAEAKKIARNLRELAKGDPNERYVIWKVGELEAQIYLEERDLVLQQMQKGQQDVNQLIVRFNAEVGKSRPDFASQAIRPLMSRLDDSKASEVASSFSKRIQAISKRVLYSIERTRTEILRRHRRNWVTVRNNPFAISESQYSSIKTCCRTYLPRREAIKAEVDSASNVSAPIAFPRQESYLFGQNPFQYQSKPLSIEASCFRLIDRVSGRMGTREDSL